MIMLESKEMAVMEVQENKINEKYDVEITCNVGIKAGSWQCDFCLIKNKCGALKLVKSNKNSLMV